MKTGFIKVLFGVAALYDGVLGIAFLVSAETLFEWAQVTPPNHFGYVHFPAALLIIFALMFMAIARDPERRRHLIPYGMLLKISYCSVVGYHWLTAGLPDIWKPFVFYDLVFLGLFVWAFTALGKPGKKQETVL